MRIIRDFQLCPPEYKGAAVALGNFDGVHPGHRAILKECLAIAKVRNVPAAAMTFEPHPREFLSRDKQKLRIYPFRRKVELLREMGIKVLFAMRFNRRLASMSAQSFVQDILARDLGVRHVITGTNFAFGKNRAGNTAFLGDLAKKSGFGFAACPPVRDKDGNPISSSAVRHALEQGNIRKAGTLLGRPYVISGRVRRGRQRGKGLGFPTANLSVKHLFKPRFGIYAVRITIGDKKRRHDAVASLGVNPTFGVNEPALEVHGFDLSQELYGERIDVEFIEFLRGEKYFDNIETLKKQMEADCQQAREVLHASQ